jgi:D-serine deaminase-like pyridoxal phosphate-dependent protein
MQKNRIELPVEREKQKAGNIIIFDSQQKGSGISLLANTTLRGIEVVYSTPVTPELVPENCYITIYLDDPISPAAKVSLKDLALQGNKRPLNLRISENNYFVIMLEILGKRQEHNVIPQKLILEIK